MIERILPPEVCAVDTVDDAADAVLFPEEEPEVARAVDRRRREFATARHCARQALARLGLPATAIPRGPKGEPCWPAGVVGSITHCAGYRAAVVARGSDLHTVGIDAEPHGPLPDGVLGAVSLPAERDMLADLAATAPGTHWDRLLFCAKESVYKAWFPLTRAWLGFEDAEVSVDADLGTFAARLLVSGPQVGGARLTGFAGRWAVTDGVVLAAVALPVAPG
ncbi:MAG TPA: 4'-phosphopantetheinyl transferase superfamily protein [Mycobacteriales bacterium]|nr:4'-phosphopantetheinyl transferase superfamily protein [Mycobacteriales bacterium]